MESMGWVLFLLKTMGQKLERCLRDSEGQQGLRPRPVVSCDSQLLNLQIAHKDRASWWVHPEPGFLVPGRVVGFAEQALDWLRRWKKRGWS